MRETEMSSNQFLRSFVNGVVHQSFARAIRHIGLPDFPRSLFIREIKPYLHLTENSRLEDGESLTRLWRSTLQGEVIATDVRENFPAFYVRSGFGTTGYVVRLILVKGDWRIDSVISVYERRFVHIPWIRRAMFAGAVAAAAALGLLVHSWTVRPPVAANSTAKVAAQAPGANGSRPGVTAHHGVPATTSRGASTKTAGAKTLPQTATTFRFHLATGMPLGDLSQFLYAHHLVGNAVAFDMLLKNTGIDKAVQPGTYIFKKGMQISQMLQELKQGPPAT